MRKNRGVSEIIASLVLLVIVSTLGVIVYNVALSNMSSQKNYLVSDFSDQGKRAQEKFVITSITKIPGGLLNVTFFNYGFIDIKITDVYVNNTKCIFNQEKPITPTSELNYLTITYSETSQKTVNILIVSERGASVEASEKI